MTEHTCNQVLLDWMKNVCFSSSFSDTHQLTENTPPSIGIQGQQSRADQAQNPASSTLAQSKSPFADFTSAIATRPDDSELSKLFELSLPLLCTVEASTAILSSDSRFEGFQKLDIKDSFIIDRGFVRVVDQVKDAIISNQPLIRIKGLHRCFIVWLRLIFELLAFHVQSDSSEHDLQARNLFFVREDPEDKRVHVYAAFSHAVVVREMSCLYEAFKFVCSFEGAVVFHDKAVSKRHIRRHSCFVLGELPIGRKGHDIDFWQSGYRMATSYRLFLRCLDEYYGKDDFKGRNLHTLYHICSGNLATIDAMMSQKFLLYEKAKRPIDFYIGGSFCCETTVNT